MNKSSPRPESGDPGSGGTHRREPGILGSDMSFRDPFLPARSVFATILPKILSRGMALVALSGLLAASGCARGIEFFLDV